MMYSFVQIVKLALMIIACVSIFMIMRNTKKINFTELTNEAIDKRLKRVPKGYFNYERIDRYLIKMGKEETPTKFIIIKIGFSFLFMLLGLRENIFLSIGLMLIGFMIPDYLVIKSNNRDNKEMAKDIKVIYDTLRIQTKAGVFINQALRECYLKVRHERLKEALLILNGRLSKDKDIETSIEEFNNKFDNPHIDALSVIIKSGLESGKTLQILEDVSEQITDIEEASFKEEENNIDRQIDKIQFMIFVGVIVTSFYGFYIELINSVTKF